MTHYAQYYVDKGWCIWLRHCTTIQMVAASIPLPLVPLEIFRRHNPSGRIMTLKSTQPLTEMRTKNGS